MVDDDAEVAQRLGHHAHVLDLGDVGEPAALAGQRRGGQQLERGVLGAADRDGPGQRPAALDRGRPRGRRAPGRTPSGRASRRPSPSRGRRALAVPPLGDPDAQQRLLELGARGGQVGAFAVARLEGPLGLAPRLLGLLEVDLARQVGRLGHDHDLVGPDLEEPADDRERLLGAALADAQLADAEHRHQRRVVRQDAELALDARDVDRIDLVLVDEALGRHDLGPRGGRGRSGAGWARRLSLPRASRRSRARRRSCRRGRRPAPAACRSCPRGSP